MIPPIRRAGPTIVAAAVLALAVGACKPPIEGGNTRPDNACELEAYAGVPQVGAIFSRTSGPCSGILIGPSTVLTAAHCAQVEDDPLIVLFPRGDGYYQYIAETIAPHPDYVPSSTVAGVSHADLAIIRLSESVSGIQPLELYPDEPKVFAEVSLIGYDDWSAADGYDPVRRSYATIITEAAAESDVFSYDDRADSRCLQGRGGGLVVGRGPSGEQYLLGIQAHDNEVVRLDLGYDCWAACDAAAGLPQTDRPGYCDCSSIEYEECEGTCGVREKGTEGACLPRPDINPCPEGLVCNGEAQCVPEVDTITCTDYDGTSIRVGENGLRECGSPGLYQTCECGIDGKLGNCNSTCTP